MLKKYKYYILVFCVSLIYITFQSKIHIGDFNTFFAAADYLKQGKNCYNTDLFLQGEMAGRYSYGSAFALILIPLTYLPVNIAFIIFFQFQTLLLFRSFFLLSKWLSLYKLNDKEQAIWWLLSVFCSLRFILHNVEFGQVTILILYLCIEGMYQVYHNHKVIGSLLLALCIHIKIMPVVLIPYLLWRKEWLALMVIIPAFLILCFVPLLIIDYQSTLLMLSGWMQSINPFTERVNQYNFTMQGLQPLFATYLLDIPSEKPGFKTNITVISETGFFLLVNFSRLFFVILTFYFLSGTSLKKLTHPIRGLWELAYLLMILPLIFPQQQKYSFLFFAPFFCYMIWFLIIEKRHGNMTLLKNKIILIYFILLMAVFILTSDLFVGMKWNHIFQSLKILTFAALLAIPLLAVSKPVTKINT